jgi:medium-chain acyl-[acyl-carrier-protein] hydrolase
MSRWLRCYQPNPDASLRLFCFPYAGGSAALFRTWVLPNVEVWGVQLPGRGDRFSEPPITNITMILDVLIPDLRSYFDRPYAFFGHSMGALLGFEMARRSGPECLFVSGRRAPQIKNAQQLHTLSDEAFLLELRRLNGTPPQVLENAELMALFLPILRADFAVCETYAYQEAAPLGCPIAAFGGTDDRTEPLQLLQGWRSQTTGEFSLQELPGDHFFLQTQQQVLLEEITKRLNAVHNRPNRSINNL